MFKNKQKQVNLLSNLKRTDEYKGLSNMAIVYAVRYCQKHRKELMCKEDVKKCFDKAIELYKTGKNNKLINEEVHNA